MRARILTTEREIAAISAGWDQLAAGVPFRSWTWLGNWWRAYGHSKRLFVVAVFDDRSHLAGIAPWYLENCQALGKVVRFLGSGDVCSDYLTVLAASGREHDVANAIASRLATSASPCVITDDCPEDSWDLLELSAIWPSDTVIRQLIQGLVGEDCIVHQRCGANCWRIPLPASWNEYLEQISKPNRRRMRWAEKRLQSPGMEHRTANDTNELEDGFRILVDLHQQRRQSLGQKGCFACPQFKQFLFRAASEFLPRNCLKLSWIEQEGKAIASMIALRGGNMIYAYQMGISADALHENPGWLIQAAAIREAIAAGCDGFDLLRGDEPYKSHLGAQARPTFDVRVVPNRIAPRLRHAAWLATNAMKTSIKSGLTFTGIS